MTTCRNHRPSHIYILLTDISESRIQFKFEGGDAYDVSIVDYH